MLHEKFGITEGVVIKSAHRDEKWEKLKQKFLNYKDKEYILKNTHYLKHRSVYIYEDFFKKAMIIRKSLWDEDKKLEL